MASYRIFPSTSGPSSPMATTGGWLLGVIFSPLGQMLWLNGYYFWVATGGDTGAQKFATWNRYSTSAENVITASKVTSGSLTANAWNFVPLSSPVQLAPGALYVATTGWTAVNGIPLTSAQWGSGQPLAAGIVNGPLTAWSAPSGSNTFPAGTVNYGLGQGLFSNALGSDPGANMANNPSGNDNFWMDVQLSTTAPSSYAGSYRLKPNMADFGNYSNDTANNFTLGLQFSLSQACAINNIWFYSPPGVTQLPTVIGVFSVGSQTLVASNSSPSWSGAAGSGWVSAPLAGTLSPGTSYKAAVCNGAASPAIWNGSVANYWTTGGFGANGLTAGPITAPNTSTAGGAGQASYNAGAAIAYPNTTTGPFDYGVDIEVTPLAAGSGLLIASFP